MARRASTGVIVLAALLAALAVGAIIAWFTMSETPSAGDPEPRPRAPREEFASDRAPPPAQSLTFDARRCLGYLEEVCKIGPRISGSEGMKKQQEMLQKHFEGQ